MTNPGDKVLIKTDEKEIEGILMPNEETDSVIIKLNNGYNMGIEKSKIKEIKVVEKYKENKELKKEKVSYDKKKPLIVILHTGGTIASKVDYKTGGVIARFSPEELVGMFPELKEIANIDSWLIANMFSEDIRFGHYSLIAKDVKKAIDKGAAGIIITYGTDTMGYSAAALAFILEELPIPVILVGAQRSSDRGSSDAAINLICAAEFIAKTDFAGVAICMHENINDENCIIMPATKTRKMHTSRRDAFKVVNDKPIARVNYKTKQIEFIKKDYKKKSDKKIIIKDKMEEHVAILRVHPNMSPKQFEFYKGYKGLIIEGTGLGQAPVGVPNKLCEIHKKNLKAIENLVKSGCIVVMTSQTIFGRVQMHVYSNAIELAKVGVISGEDMLTETAFIKLAWLLGNYKGKEEIKKMMGVNLRGEINNRIMHDEFLD